jgi:hypothetical protein
MQPSRLRLILRILMPLLLMPLLLMPLLLLYHLQL